jgi:hypothetical protein
MLSVDHRQNFNDQVIRLYVPHFTLTGEPYDQIWCTFLYMVGINYGFDKRYQFYLDDYKVLTGDGSGTVVRTMTKRFNSKWGDYIKLGMGADNAAIVEFVNREWDFIEVEITDVRLQRLWVFLYSQVWAGTSIRQDLFEVKAPPEGQKLRHFNHDTGFFIANSAADENDRNAFGQRGIHAQRDSQYVPHYLKRPARKGINPIGRLPYQFSGKIITENNE